MMSPQSHFDEVAFGSGALIEAVKNVCEILAIVGGGWWAYYNYIRGRVYRPRLECAVTSAVRFVEDQPFLEIVAKVRNVGLSKVSIDQVGTVIQVQQAEVLSGVPGSLYQVQWHNPPASFEIFQDHKSIESKEPLEDPIVIQLPKVRVPVFRITLKVRSSGLMWAAATVADWPNDEVQEGAAMEASKRGIPAKVWDQKPTDPREVQEIQRQKEEQRRREEQERQKRKQEN